MAICFEQDTYNLTRFGGLRPAACGRKMILILCSQMWPDRFRVITHIQHPDILTFYDLRPRTKPAHRSP
jgi:hypothetical protein